MAAGFSAAGKASVPIKGLHIVRKRLANGVDRYYYYPFRSSKSCFWYTDNYRYDLRTQKLPQEFISKYEAAIRASKQNAPEDTFGALIVDYLGNPESPYQRLAPATKRDRRKYLDLVREMKLKGGKPAERAPLAAFENKRMRKYIGAWRQTMSATPKKADEAKIALSAVLQWGVALGELSFNVCHGIPNIYERKEEARTWCDDEQAAFLSDASTVLRLAMLFIRWTGVRRKDAAEMTVEAMQYGEHLVWASSKSRRRHELLIPILPELRPVLAELAVLRQSFEAPPPTILFSSRGTPWTVNGLSASFNKHRVKHDIEPSIHGLRKTAATDWIIHQTKRPDLITDDMICDQFDWTRATLKRMKRIYVDRSAVVEEIAGRRA